jgi:AcrR family transcriptional regulator
MTQPRVYRGVTPDERREQRRGLLIEAGLDCLAEDGLPGVSVRSVCARARLTARYFYESFANLDELLIALVDHVAEEVAASGLEAISKAPEDLYTQARAAIDAGYSVVSEDPRKAKALLIAAAGHEPLQRRRQETILRYADMMVEYIATHYGTKDRAQTRVTALFVVGGVVELITAVLSGSLRLSRRRLVDRAAELWTAALAPGLTPAGPRADIAAVTRGRG